MISFLIFPEKFLINTITLYQILFHTFPGINVAVIRVSSKKTRCHHFLEFREDNRLFDRIDLLCFFAHLQNNVIKRKISRRSNMCEQS